jgi:16S rRNA (uracil1498-N3)-methyltransferase
LVEGSIQIIDRTGVDFVALTDLKLMPPQNFKFHVFSGFGKFCSFLLNKISNLFMMIACFQNMTFQPDFSHFENHTGTLKGGRADWLVEKCTVCFYSILKFLSG